MPDRVLLEEFHLTFTVPRDTPDAVRETIRRGLNDKACRTALRAAVRTVLHTFPGLSPVRVALTA